MHSSEHSTSEADSTEVGTAASVRERSRQRDEWWRDAVIYQIYPRSFADSDGDGIGDLPGITAHLDSVVDLGVDAIWVSPFYPSPQVDAGYDVADYRNVDPTFGTLADFDALLAKAHAAGVKVIIDLVPNHSSNQHPWFIEALAAPAHSPARDRYIFRDGRGESGELPPNNWQAVFGGPAWTRVVDGNGNPGQWYLHLFDPAQPDFNWHNQQVQEEFDDIVRFWLDRGVDGFRVDVAHALFKENGLPDHVINRAIGAMGITGPPAKDARAVLDGVQEDTTPVPERSELGPMWDQEEVHDIYRRWRRITDSYQPPRILVAEAWVQPLSRLARYVRPDEMHQAFNFHFLETSWNAPILQDVITRSLQLNNRVGATTTWVLNNHDVIRAVSRFGLPERRRANGLQAADPDPDNELGRLRATAMTLVMLGLPGSAYLYQGEELGLPEHTGIPDDQRQDPAWQRSGGVTLGRDGSRVPLPWVADAPSFGFSTSASTWLPQPESFRALARDRQLADPASTLQLYQRVLRLRREHRLGGGALEWLTHPGGHVVAYRNGPVVVLINMSDHSVPLPPGELLVASVAIDNEGELPANAAAWLLDDVTG